LTPLLYVPGFAICLLVALSSVRGRFNGILTKCHVRKIAGIVSTIFLAGLLFAPAQATTITEYSIPGNPGLWDLSVNGTLRVVWFTESAGNNVGCLNFSTGIVKQIQVPTLNSHPSGITVVDWKKCAAVFTETYGNKIGVVMRDASYNIEDLLEYAAPSYGSGLQKIVFDRARNCTWFVEYALGKIGRFAFPEATPNAWRARFVEYSLLGAGVNSNPIGIAIGTALTQPAANQPYVWVADFSRKSIVRFHPETGVFREYSIEPFSPWDLVVDSDGMVWFTAQRAGTDANIIGRINPVAYEASKWDLTIFSVPTPNAEVHEIAVDPRGNVWFTEFSDYASKIGKYVPLANTFTEYPIITPTAKPQGLAIDEIGVPINVWFTEYGGRRIGRLRQPEGPTGTTTVYSISYAVTTSSTVPTATTSPIIANVTGTTVPSFGKVSAVTTTTAATASSTIVDTVSTVLTSPTYWVTTYTYTTSTSYTTTTTTYTLTSVSVETTSTTTSVTATYVSSSWESITIQTSRTVVSISWFSETTSATTTVTQTSTIFSPTITIPTTMTTAGVITIYSPRVTLTSSTLTQSTAIATSTSATTTTSYSPTVTLTTTTTSFTTFLPVRPCVIASAAYGSELGQEVQSLRSFRDMEVLSTFAGAQFMRIFNAFYYSFSPATASFIASWPVLTLVTRILLFPLISILRVSSSIFRALALTSELGMVMAGVFASAVLGAAYIASPAMVIRYLIRKRRNIEKMVAHALSWR